MEDCQLKIIGKLQMKFVYKVDVGLVWSRGLINTLERWIVLRIHIIVLRGVKINISKQLLSNFMVLINNKNVRFSENIIINYNLH